jgi:hypothetical protein
LATSDAVTIDTAVMLGVRPPDVPSASE